MGVPVREAVLARREMQRRRAALGQRADEPPSETPEIRNGRLETDPAVKLPAAPVAVNLEPRVFCVDRVGIAAQSAFQHPRDGASRLNDTAVHETGDADGEHLFDGGLFL